MEAESWAKAPANPVFSKNEVHVWRADLDCSPQELERLRAHLSAEEQQRAAGFYFEQGRNHYAAARGILRELLSRYLRSAPSEFRFAYSTYGKPSLTGELKFNVSHSYGLALFAFASQAEVGVDVERIRPEFAGQDIAERFFSPQEADALKGLRESQRASAFFRCWTRKEAFIKAHGTGLSFPLREFTVEFREDSPACLLSTLFDPADRERWSLYALEPGSGYAGAVAVQGKNHSLRLWDFR